MSESCLLVDYNKRKVDKIIKEIKGERERERECPCVICPKVKKLSKIPPTLKSSKFLKFFTENLGIRSSRKG